MNKNEKLLRTTTYYTIGNLGSKVLSFLIVPLYTFYIDANEMGIYDVLVTTAAFLSPVIIMQMTDGLIRWLFDKSQDPLQVIHAALSTIIKNLIIAFPIMLLIVCIFSIPYGGWFIAYVYSISIYSVTIQVVRGLGDNSLYASLGVANSAILLLLNYLLIVHIGLGVRSFFVAGIISYVLPSVWIIYRKKEIFNSFKQPFSPKLARKMIRYSLMLLPNTLNWQVMNISDRYIVLGFLGTYWNGVYAISYKFPTILSTMTFLFYLAWQENVITDYQVNDDGTLKNSQRVYYSKVFKQYYRFLLPLAICAISVTKPFVLAFMSESYLESWKFTGFLYLGTVFSAFSTFYGVAYQLIKKTKGAMITTTIGAVINLMLNLALIKYVGLQASAFSTFAAFFVMFVLRVYETKSYFSLNINWKEFVFLNSITIIAIFIPFFTNDLIPQCLFVVAAIILFIFYNFKFLLEIIRLYANWLKR